MWNFLSRILNRRKSKTEKRSVYYQQGQNPPLIRTTSYYNQYGDSTYGDGLTAYYSAVSLIANTISCLPIMVYRPNGMTKERVPDHPIVSTFRGYVNGYQTGQQFIEVMAAQALSWGNGLGLKRSNVYGDIKVEFIPAGTYSIQLENGELSYRISGHAKIYGRDEVVHLRNNGNHAYGFSMLSLFAQTIDTATQTEQTVNDFYTNGMMCGWVFESPVKLKDNVKDNIQESIAGDGTGNAGKRFKALFVEGGLKAHQATVSPVDAELLGSRKYTVEEIARAFHVPAYLLGDLTKTSYASADRQNIEFLQLCLQPWLIRLENELNAKLLTEAERRQGYYVKFNLDSLLRADVEKRDTSILSKYTNGLISRQQAQALLDIEEDPEGDYVVPTWQKGDQGAVGQQLPNDQMPDPGNDMMDTNVRAVIHDAINRAVRIAINEAGRGKVVNKAKLVEILTPACGLVKRDAGEIAQRIAEKPDELAINEITSSVCHE